MARLASWVAAAKVAWIVKVAESWPWGMMTLDETAPLQETEQESTQLLR
jgi:hypothetical protein